MMMVEAVGPQPFIIKLGPVRDRTTDGGITSVYRQIKLKPCPLTKAIPISLSIQKMSSQFGHTVDIAFENSSIFNSNVLIRIFYNKYYLTIFPFIRFI